MSLKDLFVLKEILSTDSISTTRLTINEDFSKLSTGLSALIDLLHVNDGPNIIVDSVQALKISADSISTPSTGQFLFNVNTNGEVIAKSILSNVVIETPRLRLDPDPTLIAFAAGEIRWSGSDFLGWNGNQWISFTAGASLIMTTGPLVVNQLYSIVNYVAGDDFTNVGAPSNATGVQFVATGTTPSVWTHGSTLSSGSGEANTTSSLGTGIGLTLPKSGANLPFKSIQAGTGITFDTTTSANTIIINNAGSFSGYSGISGTSGVSGYSGLSGYSGGVGADGASGYSGYSGGPGMSGFSGVATSGYSGKSGFSGVATSGFSGDSGFSGYSGFGGSGYSGYSGTPGQMGISGFSGHEGVPGGPGTSGFSGYSGDSTSGYSGYSGVSGISGIGTSGVSGYSGISGISGFSGLGLSGYSGYSGNSTSGFSGMSGINGTNGTSGFSGISGATGVGASVLGPAEDGSYTDGFWTDLTTTTPIGTFADRVNEILLALLPPPSPNLSDWSQTTLALSVPGNLSFDSSNTITLYQNADGATPPVAVDQTFVQSGNRLGITQASGGTKLSGVLNYQVATGPGSPSAAYSAASFGDAEKGSLKLYINNSEVVAKTIDLTSSTSSIDTSSGGTLTGMSVSAQSSVLFANGTPLPLFQYRTGAWHVVKSDLSFGYNIIQIKHHVSVGDIRTLAGFEVVLDSDTTATAFSSESLASPSMSSPKKLSGIEYHQAGTLQYNLTINNAYRNTYSASSSAISHTGNSNTYGVLLTAASAALGPNSGNEALAVTISSKTATVSSPGKRVINAPLTLNTTVLRTVQATATSTGASLPGFLIDNVAATSTATFEGFDDEAYRMNANSGYSLVADVTNSANLWDPIQSIKDGSAGHTTGLQVIDGKLIYPGANVSYPADFRTSNITNGSTFNNGGTGGTARNYTGLTGTRYYYRKFQQVSPTTGNFIMTIAGSGGTFVPMTTSLTGTNIHVEMKAPSQTGWSDCYNDFVTGSWNDGDGSRSSLNGVGRAFGTAWGLTIGVKSTANTGGYIILRISVGASFTGSFDSITFTFA